MFNRIRATITGEPAQSSPEKSPKASRLSFTAPPSTPPERASGFLPSFLSNAQSNGSERNLAGASRSSFTAPPQEHRPSFFGGLLPQAASPSPTASPGAIRASAAALLKISTPPLTKSSNSGQPDSSPMKASHGVADGSGDRDTLEHQIHRRDQYISHLQQDLQQMQGQLSQYHKDNSTLRRQQLESTHRHGVVTKLWRRTNDGLRARVECFENETTPAAAREIANLIRDAAPPNKDSAYLMMLQEQLAKATAKLDHLGSQTEIVLHKGEEVVESLREEMNEVIRERCRMELELLDQERMLEDDMRRMVLKTERRLRRVQGEIDFLEKNAVEVLKRQESQGSQEGIEEEDKSDSCAGEGAEKEEEGKDGGEDESSHGHESGGEATVEGKGGSPDDSIEEAANPQKEAAIEPTPEVLRKELRDLAAERDRSLSVLQKKLRDKNEEFHALVQLKEEREKSINKFVKEKQDREEWERSRRQEFG